MQTRKKAIDLVAEIGGKRIAIEIETGKNSRKQIMGNIKKCLQANFDGILLIPTNERAFLKIKKLLDDHNLMDDKIKAHIPSIMDSFMCFSWYK